LGVLLIGTGHLYVGEYGRGAMYLASGLIFGLGFASLAGSTVDGPAWLFAPLVLAGPVLWIASAVDACRGAQHYNANRVLRRVTGRVWALSATMVVAGLVFVGAAASEPESNFDAYEECVRNGLLSESECAGVYASP
jgi:hypothetical protein